MFTPDVNTEFWFKDHIIGMCENMFYLEAKIEGLGFIVCFLHICHARHYSGMCIIGKEEEEI